MNRLLTSATLALFLAAALNAGSTLAANEENVQSGGDAEACLSEISNLRQKIGEDEDVKEGDHELLGGLTAEEAGQPPESWHGSPPGKENMLAQLDDAEALAEEGDAEGCHALVEQVQEALFDGNEEDEKAATETKTDG
ncbi:MAG: hypothetical protein WD341_09685 [Tistlia sp.]|uniref:hypothetical protein n=1 Tax=Tistlia sp. TaxID=3057121 RepID=UPI0034A1295D